ncbi:MAG: AAA family ATPase [Anaerolineaceae bacterium]|nr:AAA family ATPase [Anaerolineaceae bacterium]
MIPIRLELKNFLAYRSPDPVRFDGIHLACLIGANGAGKSSLLDAITWALWGEARAKRDDELVHMGQSDMLVQLDFEQEGTNYRVIRRRSRKGRGTGALDLFSVVDGQPNTLSEPSIRETQDKINRLLRLDYETFTSSAFLQQGKADAFTTKAPSQRKQILSDILGLAQWERYEEAAKETLKTIASELSVIEQRIKDIDEELAKEPRLKQILNEAEAAQQEAEAALKVAEEKLAEVADSPAQMKAAQERKAEVERHRRERERDMQAIITDITRQEARIADYQAVIARREEIEAGYAALQSARDADTALGDKLIQLSDFDVARRDLETRLRDARAELESEASAYTAQIAELQRALEQADSDALSQVQAEVTELQTVEASRNGLQEQMNAMNEDGASLRSLLKTLEDDGKKQGIRIDQLKATESATCPLCGQPLDEQHRLELVNQLETELTEMRDQYRQHQERSKAIKLETDGFKVQILEWDTELKRLQPLMKQVGELQAQMDRANEAEARLTEISAKLEAVQSLLTGETFAQDIRDQLTALEAERAQIGYDRSSHDAARQQLDTYRAYETQQTELAMALNALPDVQAALEGAKLRQERNQKALDEDTTTIEVIKTDIAKLEVLVKEQQSRQQEVNRLRTFERQQYQRLVNARQELDTLDKLRTRKGELEARQQARKHDQLVYDELRKAFGKNGVPAMIIEAAIPELEESANLLLSRMTDGRMNLHFSTQREKISTEGVIETLDIEIADELGTRSYELYSGGEAFRINFAIRVALSQMLARRAGAHLRTLFIDEGFGTQDEDGRNKLVEAITAIQDEFELVLVITHIDDLRDSFPVHILVEKTPNGSRISVR